jgi:Baseplate J-like protein
VIDYTDASQTTLGKLLAELAAAGFDPTQSLQEALAGAFTLQVSTADGWFALDSYEAIVPDPWDAAPQLRLQLTLPAAVPAIVPFQSDDPAAADPAPGLPTLVAWLRQEPVLLTGNHGTAWIYPLSLLNGIEVAKYEINTRVSNLPGLALINSDGELDPASPFPLLGGVPVVGSYLEIRHQELFVKVPRSLEIGVRWFGLPPNGDGFRGWYRDYVIGLDGQPSPTVLLDNASFLGSVSVKDPGAWVIQSASLPCDEAPPEADVYLFRTRNDCANPVPTPDGALCTETRFDTLQVCPAPDGEPPYYDPAASALRLQLTAPSYAFGNDLYAVNVLNAVLQDLPDVPACEAKCAEECLPFQEAARGLEACLAGCADVPDAQYAACILPCIETVQETLLLTFIERFLGCLETCLLGEDRLTDFRDCLQTCMTLPGTRRALGVKACVEQLRASLAGDLLRCVESCLAKNLRFLEALFWIEECVVACQGSPTYKDCMTASLAGCIEQLDAAYEECLAMCMAACTAPPKDLKYPNEPWLPTAETVTIDYEAGTTLTPGDDKVFHLLPFGGWRNAGASLLPRFPAQGNLYLGFSGLLPAQRLNLLFQMTATSGEAALPPVVWQCLSGNDWQPLKAPEVLSDTTYGLANTGVVAFSLPAFDPAGHTILPGDSQWLRASVATSPERFPSTAGIAPHVLTATWQDDGGGTGEHLRQPLPAHTITSSVQDLAFIAAIDQPLESFGGRPAEDQRGLDVRLSERLRHKDRGILAWDYERLVLERFPTIWKVQALPARNVEKGDAPGDVLVVVVAGPDSQQVQDPTTPLVPGELLYEIETYLKQRISPFIDLRVVNPNYVRITVTASVLFEEGEDPGTNIARLNDDLVQYLSPWFYDAARAAKEGRYAFEDEISEFVQNRPYVAALASIDFTYDPPERPEWCFLTSAAAHLIQQTTILPCEGRERSDERLRAEEA